MTVDTPAWVRDAVFYQIFPDRFASSGRVPKPGVLEPWDAAPTRHGFKGGDLLGIVEHLDDLVDLGITAVYLTRGPFVLELLHFSDRGTRPYQPRVMNDPGLTHVSLSCDVERVVPRIAEFGGAVLTDTDIGFGVFVRDPDGQLLELLPLAYAERVARGE